jgi:hypothetical protein
VGCGEATAGERDRYLIEAKLGTLVSDLVFPNCQFEKSLTRQSMPRSLAGSMETHRFGLVSKLDRLLPTIIDHDEFVNEQFE